MRGSIRRIEFTRYLAVLLMTLITAPAATAGSCLPDLREIDLDGTHVLRLRDFLCRTNDGKAQLRVQFQRLNDWVASLALAGSLSPRLEKVIGTGQVVKNSVSQEFDAIFARFGSTEYGRRSELTALSGWLRIETVAAGRALDGFVTETVSARDSKELYRNQEDGPWWPLPSPDALASLQANENATPPGWKRAGKYVIWRYLKKEDLDNYGANVKRLNRLLGVKARTDLMSELGELHQRHVGIIRHFARAGWAEEFVIVAGVVWDKLGMGCNNEWSFGMHPRVLMMDVAVIENVSTLPVTIDGLLGLETASRGLRPIEMGSSARSRLSVPRTTLAPGERLILPQRLLLAFAGNLQALFQKQPGDKPKFAPMAYGPEVALAGLEIGSETIPFDRPSANFLSITTSCDCGSCPYLYGETSDHHWHAYGKVIHTAHDKIRETTETIVTEKPTFSFKLAEHEPEMAFIDQAVLTVSMRGGKEFMLQPDRMDLAVRDGQYARIAWGEALRFSFQLPAPLKLEDVARTSLSVTGHYIRYSDLDGTGKPAFACFRSRGEQLTARLAR